MKDIKTTLVLVIALGILMSSTIGCIETTSTPTPTPTLTPQDTIPYYTYTGEKKYAQWEEGDIITLYCIETGKDVDWYYQLDIFDCSEMSALYERAFENAGYNAKIAAGYSSTDGHAWVVVEKEDEGDGVNWLWFEATAQQFVSPINYEDYLDNCFTFDNIIEALEYSEEEFNWWKELEDFENVIWVYSNEDGYSKTTFRSLYNPKGEQIK